MEFYGTIGPACAQLETLQRMVEAGMTGIRMNLSHGPLSAHKDWLDIIHAVGIPQLLIDLQGPELRIGTLPQPLVLEPGQSLRLGQGGVPCPAALVHAARPGQNLLLDDGRLLVQVAEADGAALQCTVIRGGTGADGGLPHVDGGGPAKPAAGGSLRRYRGDAALRAGG